MKKFKRVVDSQVVLTELMLPSYANFNGKIHGGYILSLMDQIAFACAAKHAGCYCVTASVNTVDFINPVEVGNLLTLKASINWTGNTSMVVGIRVESENVKTNEFKHCNSSYFTMVAKDEKENSLSVPGLLLCTKDEIRRYIMMIVRKEMVKERREKYKKTDFLSEKYIQLLDNYNVKLECVI